jgi:hypothetical protein
MAEKIIFPAMRDTMMLELLLPACGAATSKARAEKVGMRGVSNSTVYGESPSPATHMRCDLSPHAGRGEVLFYCRTLKSRSSYSAPPIGCNSSRKVRAVLPETQAFLSDCDFQASMTVK